MRRFSFCTSTTSVHSCNCGRSSSDRARVCKTDTTHWGRLCITDARNTHLYTEWANFIETPPTRGAFCYIVGVAACSPRFLCHIQWKGQVRDFRFHEASGDQPFSFITIRRWLLFYFRLPAVRSGAYLRDLLEKDFRSFRENPQGEWTIKLRNIADFDRLLTHVNWNAP